MLSKQLQKQIDQEAAHEARMHFHPQYSRDQNTACRINYKNGAEKYAALYETAVARAERAEKALEQIRDWKLPSTGRFWDAEETQPMSYEACYGSNGVRDYFRNLANQTLHDNKQPKALTPKTGEDG